MTKRYYWLKLKENFFNTPHLKAMRKLPGGTELCIIYLKMMLQSIKNKGILLHTLETNSFADELSLILEENSQSIDMVLHFLTKNHLIEQVEDDTILLMEAQNCIGSESSSAEKMRRKREKEKQIFQISEKSHCDQNVTLDKDKEIDIDSNNNSKEIINNYKKLKYITPKGDLNNKENIAVVVDALQKIDINEKVATELYAKYGKEVILAALKDMQNRKDILRPGGYLIAMLQKSCSTTDNQHFNTRKTSPKQCEFCKSCKRQYDDNMLCQKDGTRYDYQTGNWVECEYVND